MKKTLGIIVILLVLCTGIVTILTINQNDNDKQKKKEKENIQSSGDIYIKINPLVWFNFKVQDDTVTVTDYKLENDKAREIFKEVDFKNLDLMKAIELYGDKVSENGIEFTTIYVWTTWNNKEYFKSKKYNLDVTVVDEEKLKDIPQDSLPTLKYNKKYYQVDDEHGYNIVFKENGVLEYHIDNEYTVHQCDEYEPTDCYDLTFNDEMYMNMAQLHQYSLDGNIITISGKDGEFYQGWHMAYDKCEVQFNRIKCDNYNAYHGNVAEYQYTKYYELRNE